MTRSRLGTVLWVPEGDAGDPTRNPQALDETAEVLLGAGARMLEGEELASTQLSKAPVTESQEVK